jgi:biotin carboxyl carrier protein
LVLCVVFTTIGGVGGWIAARQETGGGGADHPLDEDPGDAPAKPTFTAQTLRNLGVTVAPLKPATFTRTRDIPAVIARTQLSEQPVFAVMGGRVQDVRVEPGMVVTAGQSLLTFVREPIPRPQLTLTEDILKPAGESVHQTVAELRRTKEEIGVFKTELDRIAQYTGRVGEEDLPILPRQTAIDLRYKVLLAERSHEQARLELQKHGFSEEQIASIVDGGAIPPLGEDSWKRALERNGLWPPAAEELISLLPERMHPMPWVVATVGELAASGLIGQDLVGWLREVPDDCAHFLEIGSLLQRGYSVPDIHLLHDLGALDPLVDVSAPGAGRVPDWDVHDLNVKPGSQVRAGDRLLTLLDWRVMYLRTEPVGGEKSYVLDAVAEGTVCAARPLIEGSGPVLESVTLGFLSSEPGGGGTVAFAKVDNVPLAVRGAREERRYRSWKLREGLPYVLQIPVQVFSDVFVLPRGAVTSDGHRRVVFIQNGESFDTVEVEIAYEDERVVVVPKNAEAKLFADDPVVQTGAYALGLALQGSGRTSDPHAGHQH